MRQLALVIIVLLAFSCEKPKVDLIFRNVTVCDGTNTPCLIKDVAISADTIYSVEEHLDLEAYSIIDATDLVLAPGFIDTHSHHDWGIDQDRTVLSAVSQGITTIVVGQDGGSNTPLQRYFQSLVDSPVAINVASYTGHNTIRYNVMGEDYKRVATSAEIDSMALLLRADMDAGALGLSTGLEYDPGIYSTAEEVLTLSKILPEYEGRYISHMRSEDRYFWKALDEIITIGRQAKIPVQVSHFKLAMVPIWNKADSALAILNKAHEEGVNITADIYPYPYWASTITVLFPSRNFKDLKEAEMILKEIAKPEDIILSKYDPNPEFNGKSVSEVSTLLKLTPAKTLIELIARLEKCSSKGKECDGSIVATSMHEDDIVRLMQWEHTNICSDGASSGLHPRGFGAFTRVLKHYVREAEELNFPVAINKMTALSAEHVGILKRGTIVKGNYADLVLFNPNTVADKSTIRSPQAISEGIVGAWVNGKRVFEAGSTTGEFPGRVIRRGNQ